MSKFSLTNLFGMTIRESANDGSDFTNPDADYRRLYLGEDGGLHLKDSAGTVTDVGGASGSVATDAIWDAAGDLAQGTGANTGAKLTLGASGKVVKSNGSTNIYDFPPGYEFAYAEITSDFTTTSTSATDVTGLTSGNFTADGAALLIHVMLPEISTTAGADGRTIVEIYDTTGTAIKQFCVSDTGLGVHGQAVSLWSRETPSAGTQSYKARVWTIAAGTLTVRAAATSPAFIRVVKV